MFTNPAEGRGPERNDPEGPRDPIRIHDQLWSVKPPVVGMVHLLPLPGAPAYGGSMTRVRERAQRDAEALLKGGIDGLLVENYGDRPFLPGNVSPVTTSAMAVLVAELVREAAVPVGVNVLRNDALGALSVAAAAQAHFIRVNVHTGSMFTDQGIISGQAHHTLRQRRALCPEVAILADVFVKHGTPPPGVEILEAARDTWIRGLADGLILTGSETGQPADLDAFPALRASLPEGARLWVGSGVGPENAGEILAHVDGLIVGSAFQDDGVAGRGVRTERVRDVMAALGRA
jgi:membrane complex biogenesis BtpA family protein